MKLGLSTEAMLIAGALVAVALGVLLLKKNIGDLAVDVGAGAAEAVLNTGAGVAIGIGDAIGIPRTNETECEKALSEGRTWDASFACPAGTFIKSWF